MLSTTDAANITLFTFELLGAVCGNGLLLFALYISKDLHRSVSSNLMFNSAVIDSVSVIITIPLAMDYLIFQTGNLNGTFAPMIINAMFTFWMLLMQHSALAMMADRLMIVKWPSFYHNVATLRKARLAIGVMWLNAIPWTSVIFTVRGLQTPQIHTSPLEYMARQHHLGYGKYIAPTTIVIFVLLNGFICVMVRRELAKYLKKRTELWKSISDQGSNTTGQEEIQRMKAETKKNNERCNTVLIILASFVLSVLPSVISSLASLFGDDYSPKHPQLSTVVIMTTQLNSLLNPYILIYRSTKHRQLLKRQINKIRRRSSGNRTNSINVHISMNRVA